MKKIIAAAVVTCSLAASPAFAKTEGNYVGLDYVLTHYRAHGSGDANSISDPASGFGLNYRHAISMDGMFVAPGVFFDRIVAKKAINDKGEIRTNYNYGIRADLGYDLDDKLALYGVLGYSMTDVKSSNVEGGGINYKKKDTVGDFLYGLGAKVALGENTLLRIEYILQDFKAKTANNASGSNQTQINLDALKIGVGYRF